MPGMAASPTIFERIQLPDDTFEMHLLEWEIPNAGETLSAYAQRIAQKVKEDNPIFAMCRGPQPPPPHLPHRARSGLHPVPISSMEPRLDSMQWTH